MKPCLLDLFCGAGGAGEGYRRAGFEVTGVDKVRQKRYCAGNFVQADALEYLAAHGHEFDAIHASPPCQAHSRITPNPEKHVDLIPATRKLLDEIGKPYVIENVMGAPLQNAIMLCGAQFGLKVYRHRLFESNVFLLSIGHYPHRDCTPRAGHGVSDKGFISVTSGGNSTIRAGRRTATSTGLSAKGFVSVVGHISGIDYCRMAMGIDWMVGKELSQAIPPAYTEYIGRQLIAAIQHRIHR